MVRLKVDLIVAGSLTVSVPAKQATDTVPIVVILGTGEAIKNGIVDNIARPGGNITGMAGMRGAQWIAKQFELLREAVPKASRVAVLANVTRAGVESRVEALRSAAQALGWSYQSSPCRIQTAWRTRSRRSALNVGDTSRSPLLSYAIGARPSWKRGITSAAKRSNHGVVSAGRIPTGTAEMMRCVRGTTRRIVSMPATISSGVPIK